MGDVDREELDQKKKGGVNSFCLWGFEKTKKYDEHTRTEIRP